MPRLEATMAAHWAMVGASKRVASGRSTAYRFRIRLKRRTAMSDWPPSSKKSSLRPTCSTPSSSRHIAASSRSIGVAGGTNAELMLRPLELWPADARPLAVAVRRCRLGVDLRHPLVQVDRRMPPPATTDRTRGSDRAHRRPRRAGCLRERGVDRRLELAAVRGEHRLAPFGERRAGVRTRRMVNPSMSTTS